MLTRSAAHMSTVIKAEGQRNAITCRHCGTPLRPCQLFFQRHRPVRRQRSGPSGEMHWLPSCAGGLPVRGDAGGGDAAGHGHSGASAHKCDLCQGREAGPACVENCPAQALTLADDETLITLAKQRRLRSASPGEVQPWQRATPLCSQPNAGAKRSGKWR